MSRKALGKSDFRVLRDLVLPHERPSPPAAGPLLEMSGGHQCSFHCCPLLPSLMRRFVIYLPLQCILLVCTILLITNRSCSGKAARCLYVLGYAATAVAPQANRSKQKKSARATKSIGVHSSKNMPCLLSAQLFHLDHVVTRAETLIQHGSAFVERSALQPKGSRRQPWPRACCSESQPVHHFESDHGLKLQQCLCCC